MLMAASFVVDEERRFGGRAPQIQKTRFPLSLLRRANAAEGESDRALELSVAKGHVGAKCDASRPCLAEGKCVNSICRCDEPNTHVVEGICESKGWTEVVTLRSETPTEPHAMHKTITLPDDDYNDTEAITPP
ncbi:uncharacterized protein LOC144159862 [Haemaphysalis longicornis]